RARRLDVQLVVALVPVEREAHATSRGRRAAHDRVLQGRQLFDAAGAEELGVRLAEHRALVTAEDGPARPHVAQLRVLAERAGGRAAERGEEAALALLERLHLRDVEERHAEPLDDVLARSVRQDAHAVRGSVLALELGLLANEGPKDLSRVVDEALVAQLR